MAFHVDRNDLVSMVPGRELESPHLAIHGPEPCASTNSATRAQLAVYHYINDFPGPKGSKYSSAIDRGAAAVKLLPMPPNTPNNRDFYQN